MQNPAPPQGITPAEVLLRDLTGSGQGMSVDALQVQVSQLSEQSLALQAQRDVLRQRMSGMPRNEARADLQVQRNQLDVQITQIEMQLESAKAQIASRVGVQSYMVGSNGKISLPRRGPDQDMVFGLSFVLAISIALPIAIAYARRIWRGKPKDAPAKAADDSAQRMERLEQGVDAIAIEIERVAEGQRFVTKILAERPPVAVASVRSPSVDAADAALGEAKPFLALGAGPMEQIRVAERQAVKQSITPH